MVDFVFGDDVELVCELAGNLGSSPYGYYYLPGHAHCDLNKIKGTGPI